jgi:hypothetical protein
MGPRSKLVAALAAAVLVGAIAVWALPGGSSEERKPPLGLLTSLPIYWAESDSITETLEGGAPTHWVRSALEADYVLLPIDTLDSEYLGGLDRLILAQPRPLAPAENVALDDWVRGGGRLLLFADPLLTEHSRFMLGDKRRPQDVVVLSPILRRWGLELEFDEDEPDAGRLIRFEGAAVPVRLPGRLREVTPGAAAKCGVESESVVARCIIGQGRVLVVADAAVLGNEQAVDVGTPALNAFATAAFAD